jgi:hypothetical protein
MEIQEALKIMRALADGLSPETGEVLSADLVYQYAPVVRAFHRAVGALEIMEERERSRRAPATNAGRSWSRAECAGFARSCGEELISIRSQGLTIELLVRIVARLVRLGKIGPETPLDIFGAKVAQEAA